MRKRVDANQKEIIQAFKDCGCSVFDTSQLGQGFPDLVVGHGGNNYLVEVKDGSKPPSKRVLTPKEEEFHYNWEGQIAIVKNAKEARLLVDENIQLMKVIDAHRERKLFEEYYE